MAARQKKLTHPLPKAGHSRGYLQNLWSFYLSSSSSPLLCAIKETGIQTPIRWLFWDFSLPSSRSTSFLNKVVFLASTPCLRFIGLSCGKQSELGVGNKSTLGSTVELTVPTRDSSVWLLSSCVCPYWPKEDRETSCASLNLRHLGLPWWSSG